ncbi:MAG: hypothetical protein IPP08_06765 [Chlorobiota bacterium]|nr:hypothetical protein [Chlorobiota bacterium]QQS65489.1 MAG: hypothetical protein IPP08_06765 [Chlorobiota bacterium]
MLRILFTILISFLTSSYLLAQDNSNDEKSNSKLTIEELKENLDGLTDRVVTTENDLINLKKIKISGYLQSDWLRFDQKDNVGGKAFYSDSRKNLFTIRRGRIKFQYKSGPFTGVLQPDISEGGVTIKDVYGELGILPNDELKFTFGSFNRPNYEVELSSSAREATERSQVTRAFYPQERDLGIMFTYQKELITDFMPKIQLGIFNGGGALTASETDPYKDIIGRLTFGLPLGSESPIQIDLGASMYYGGTLTGDSIISFQDSLLKKIKNVDVSDNRGFGTRKNFNIEAQVYLDLLPFGGTILKGELMSGSRPFPKTGSSNLDSLVLRNQNGFYAYLVQNITNDFQIAARFDTFDKNTDLSGSQVKSVNDAKTSILGFGGSWFYENIRFTLWHELPSFDTNELGIVDDVKDTKTTFRCQFKF